MPTSLHRILVLMAIICWNWKAADAQTGSALGWDHDASAVAGYAVTIDGVRVDYELTPLNKDGTCGCSIPAPFSGGGHTIVVTAYNAVGEISSEPVVVGPSASAGGPYAGQVGSALVVSGSGSRAPTGTLTTYQWNWGDSTTASGPSPQASHTYSTAGTFTITLTVTDNGFATAAATTSATITAAATTQLPATPSNPTPAASSTSVSISPKLPTLGWSSTDATSYAVNFGIVSPPPLAATDVTTPTYAPGSLVAGTTYFWQVIARNAAGTTAGPVWSFTTAAMTTAACPCSIWTLSTTPGPVGIDESPVELGLKFTADVNGSVTGVRFYKYAQNIGPHVGSVWTASGTLLGTETFTGETPSGWQEARFATPIAITANTPYVVSYHTSTGHYAITAPGLTIAVDHAPLHALSDGDAGGNGVFRYGATSAFPDQSWTAANYWVDVVFAPADTTRPTVTSVMPPSGTTNVATTTAVTASFSEAIAAGTIDATQVLLLAPGSVAVPASVTYDEATRTVTLTPAMQLANATTYTATVKAGVTDLAGNSVAGDIIWAFTTIVPLPPAPSLPRPMNAAARTSRTPTLTWTAPGATSYDVRFGTSNPPLPVAIDIATTAYAPESLAASTTYFWQVIARNAAGTTTGPVWSFTTTTCPCSIWTLSTTPGPIGIDGSSVELGFKFTADVSGSVTGVRFYKYAQNIGSHVGSLWTASGTLLGTVTFTGETPSGWQEARFATPIAIAANTPYVVSYHTSTGHYAFTVSGLTIAVDHAPLHVLSNSDAGGNGVFHYGATSAFPDQSAGASNYWVDVVFESNSDEAGPIE